MFQNEVTEKQNDLYTNKPNILKTIFTSLSSEKIKKRQPFPEKIFTPFEQSKYSTITNNNYKVEDVLNGLHLLCSGTEKCMGITNRDTLQAMHSLKQLQKRHLSPEENKLKRMMEKIEFSQRKLIKDVFDLEIMYENYKTNNKSCLDLKNISNYVLKNETRENLGSSNPLEPISDNFSSNECIINKRKDEMCDDKVLHRIDDKIKLSKNQLCSSIDVKSSTQSELHCLYNSFDCDQRPFSKISFKRSVKEKDKLVKKVVKRMIKKSPSIMNALNKGKNVRVEVDGLPPIIIKNTK